MKRIYHALTVSLLVVLGAQQQRDQAQEGQSSSKSKPVVFGDYRQEHPGVVHKITLADLPAPSNGVDKGIRSCTQTR